MLVIWWVYCLDSLGWSFFFTGFGQGQFWAGPPFGKIKVKHWYIPALLVGDSTEPGLETNHFKGWSNAMFPFLSLSKKPICASRWSFQKGILITEFLKWPVYTVLVETFKDSFKGYYCWPSLGSPITCLHIAALSNTTKQIWSERKWKSPFAQI